MTLKAKRADPIRSKNQNRHDLVSQLKKHVHFLCNPTQLRHFYNPSARKRACFYIRSILRKYGHRPNIQEYRTSNVDPGTIGRNVIVEFGNPKEPAIIIGAHYDSHKDGSPGADDNASSVACLLELSRLLKLSRKKIRHVILVAFDNEERPCFDRDKPAPDMGSFRHAKSLKESGQNIEYMICLEMLGFYSTPPVHPKGWAPYLKWFFPRHPDFLVLLSKDGRQGKKISEILSSDSPVKVVNVDFPPLVNSFYRMSDNMNYHDFGFKSFLLTDTAAVRNLHYHKLSDTPDTLNYENMSHITRSLAQLLER